MLRKLITIIATLALLAAVPLAAQADTTIPALTKQAVFTIGSKTVTVDGQAYQMDVAPYIDQNGRTQVPVRFLGDVLNMSALWHPANQSVLLTRNDRNTLVSLTIGSNKLDITDIVNSQTTMDTTPVIVPPGRTMLPARWVAQAIGYQVSWDAAARTVTVTPPNQPNTPTGPVQGTGSGNDGGVGTGTGITPPDTNNAVVPGGFTLNP